MTPSLEELKKQVDRYFGDTTRTQGETSEGLQDLVDHCLNLIEMLEER